MPTRIAIVEDDQPFVQNVAGILRADAQRRSRSGVTNAEDALRKIAVPVPEVLLVDINLPKMNGIEFVGQFTQRHPGVICLILTMYEESALIFDALKAGACGYLLKRTPPAEIVAAIEEAKAGGSPMTPQIASRGELFSKTRRRRHQPNCPAKHWPSATRSARSPRARLPLQGNR